MKQNKLALPDKLFGIETGLLVTFIPLGVLILTVLVSLNMVIIPKYDDLKSMLSEIKMQQDKNQTIVEKTRYLQSIDPEELKKNSDLIGNALLPQKNSYVLVGVVKSVAEKYSYQIDSFVISPGKLSKEEEVPEGKSIKGVSKIPIRVSIVGPKTSYLEFVKAIERTLPVLTINSFKMENQGSLIKLQMDIAASYIEDNSKFDIARLSLTDLTLKKEETTVISTLNEYTVVQKEGIETMGAKTEYKKYDRPNPFIP